MAETLVIQPDTGFLRELLRSGGADLKKCYQCATCSAVCALSSEQAPFPRRQMLEAQWGLKDRVLGDPAIWLCHDCGDCTAHCPRGARPGDVFGALRREAIRHFAWPAFLGRWVNDPRALPLLVLIPVLLFGFLWAFGPEAASTHPGRTEFANEFPVPLLEAVFFTISAAVIAGFAVGLKRSVRAWRDRGAASPIWPNLLPALREIATHRRFAQCGAERWRYRGHLLVMWGFVGLAAVGTVIGLGHLAGAVHTPLAQSHPLKILANASGAVVLFGLGLVWAGRLQDPARRARTTYFDWYFLVVLAGVVLTGALSELLRERQMEAMYAVYFVHLVLIFMLFVSAPYSKLAHLAYRTAAMAASGGRAGR